MVSTFEKYFVYYCFYYDLDFDNDLVLDSVLDFDNEKKSLESNVDYYNKKIMDFLNNKFCSTFLTPLHI